MRTCARARNDIEREDLNKMQEYSSIVSFDTVTVLLQPLFSREGAEAVVQLVLPGLTPCLQCYGWAAGTPT